MQIIQIRTSVAAVALLIAGTLVCSGQSPLSSATGPDADAYGATEHFPVGSPGAAFQKKYMVGSFSHFDTLYPVHTIAPAPHPWEFHRPAATPEISYVHAGNRYLLKDYLAHLPITGLLIARDDQLLFEGYQYQRTDRDRFLSQSMVKTIVGMLAGIAVSDHALASTAGPASQYVPELKNSDYGKITVRDLLHMSSGVTCQAQQSTLGNLSLQDIAQNCKQTAPAGTRFRYSAVDSQVLGLIVGRAVNMPLARYLQQKIWQHIGTESKATWTVDAAGRELAFCCFNATLRDYARFARLLAYDGAWNGNQLIPRQWLLAAATVQDSDPELVPGKSVPFFGYGYQLWIFPGSRRMFALIGSNGQRIFVDPQSKLIMVQTAVMEQAVDLPKDAETIGLWRSLVRHYGAE